MAKPFTSHDGSDSNGVRAEVFVQTGTGTISDVEGKDGTKANVQVKINAPHLTRPVKGWLAKNDPLFPVVLAALESGREVEYRVESQRKNGVPRETPIADLRKDTETAAANCINLLAGIDGTLTKEAVTDPAEDPHAGGRIPASASDRKSAPPAPNLPGTGGLNPEQALAGLAAARTAGLPQGVIDAATALALAAGATGKQVAEAGVATDRPRRQPPAQQPRSFAHEAAPHIPANTDGRLNLGNYAVQAAFGAEQVAAGLIGAHAEQIALDSGEPAEPVSLPQAAGLAGVLLQLADRVQVGAYGGGRADRMAASHTRARSLVYDAVRTRHPVPFNAEPEQRIEWMDAVTQEGIERFRLLISIAEQVYEAPVPAAQQSAEQPVQPTDEQPTEQDETGDAAGDAAGEDEQPAEQGTVGAQTARPRPPAEGEDGFVAPDADTVRRFAALAQAAGFAPTPDSPVLAYLTDKFGVGIARKVHGPALSSLIDWYENQGAQAAATFAEHVQRVAGTTERRTA
jgi:hypothetical protein